MLGAEMARVERGKIAAMAAKMMCLWFMIAHSFKLSK